MNNKSKHIKAWRQNTKQRIINSMGGCCQVCKYNKCNEALDLHHVIPEDKEISIGKIMANPKSWEKVIVPELRKCILLCANCHREFHAGIIQLPQEYARFDEAYAVYKTGGTTFCPVCGVEKPKYRKYCSLKCSSKASNKINWELVDLQKLFEQNKSCEEIGDLLNCSGSAVHKRAKKIGLQRLPKSIIKKKKFCSCGNYKSHQAKQCTKCSAKAKMKIKWPDPQSLQEQLDIKPVTAIAKDLGVSEHAVRKFVKKHGLKNKPVGYWRKLETGNLPTELLRNLKIGDGC